MEFKDLREALEFMFEINNKSSTVTDQNGRPASVEDMKELNMEALVSMADLVGMSELYLDDQPA